MKRTLRFLMVPAATLSLVFTATPALAQETFGDEGVGAVICGCYGILILFGLATFAFWIWMLIDVIQRQEYEFPNSTGNSKTIWLVIMLASWVLSAYWLAAVIYYFMVFKKIKRGTTPPPAAGGGYGPPPAGPGMTPPPPSQGGNFPPPAPPTPGSGPPPPPPFAE